MNIVYIVIGIMVLGLVPKFCQTNNELSCADGKEIVFSREGGAKCIPSL